MGEDASRVVSLVELATREGHQANRHGTGAITLAVDARSWMCAAQAIFISLLRPDADHENVELRGLFYRLAWLSRSGVNAVFVFDGPDRLKIKRGRPVVDHPSWLIDSFKEFVRAFGFHCHMAPGEAHAEIAYLCAIGAADIVLTANSDLFVFRVGLNVIQSVSNHDEDRHSDDVTLFSADALAAQRNGAYTQAGLLLIAILCGGDYSMVRLWKTTGSTSTGANGVPGGCHLSLALSLAEHYPELGESLLTNGTVYSGTHLIEHLRVWRFQLQCVLKYDLKGLLGKKHPDISDRLPEIFPDPAVLDLYCNPLTSGLFGGVGNSVNKWMIPRLPSTSLLAALCRREFGWRNEVIERFRSKVWNGFVIRRLAQSTNGLPCGFRRICKVAHATASAFPFFQVEYSAIELAMEARDALVTSAEPENLLGCTSMLTLYVWVPEPILQAIAPIAIRDFFTENHEIATPPERTAGNYEAILGNTVEVMYHIQASRKRRNSSNTEPATHKRSRIVPMGEDTTKTTATKAKGRKKKTDASTGPTYQEACAAVSESVKNFAKSKKTLQSYEGYVRRGKEFIEKFTFSQKELERQWKDGENAGKNLSTSGKEGEEDQIPIDFDPEFPNALKGRPIKCTPDAIAMFLTHKVMSEGLSKSTASTIRAAFLQHYDQMDSDRYRGQWRFNEARKEWEGNPVHSAAVNDVMVACKNKGEESERKHSRAMSIEDMRKLHHHFLKECPPPITLDPTQSNLTDDQRKAIGIRAQYLHFNALSTSAFICWMRIGEVVNLQYKNFEFNGGPGNRRASVNGKPTYFTLNLRNRKNWQKREKNGEHQLSGHCYKIYPQSETPEIDMYNHVLDWLDFYEVYLLGRPLGPEDFIFPTVGANVQPTIPITPDVTQKRIVQMATAAGVQKAEALTTHCFRRGGAQYRFMFAPEGQRWTLARIRWWGGWAIGEHRNTLIRYLLDELYTYEEDHSDALNPANSTGRTGTTVAGPDFSSGSPTQSIGASRLNDPLLYECRQVRQLLSEVSINLQRPTPPQFFPTQFNNMSLPGNFFPLQPFTSSFASVHPGLTANITPQADPAVLAPEDRFPTSFTAPYSASAPTPVSQSVSASSVNLDLNCSSKKHIVPGFPSGTTRLKCWEIVVKDWEFADESRSLYVALKDWRPEWYRNTSQTQKYGQRRMVAKEFIHQYERDEHRFLAAYPEHVNGFTPLLNAIRVAKQLRGDCDVRLNRRKKKKKNTRKNR
ncbi:hypothetical protein D9613_004727 [Agrocybe pediades]|uniref:XPG-I domain-containing protein n=1 Tax=Agrocybe pediades TaxID=84607 RepID=A0A8H4QYS2_9AGAR|nr:hypothetical protein D9613_004727 [Agrocybe pediades]